MSFLQTLIGGGAHLRKGREEAPKALNYDPFVSALSQADYASKLHPGTFAQTYDQLDWWARQPIVQQPPMIRSAQVVEHCQPTDSEWKPGFMVRLRDEKKDMSRAAIRKAQEISEVIHRAGGKYQWPPTGSEGANMETAMSQFVRQSLIYDQGVFEVLYTRGDQPYGWLPQDARTFRLAMPTAKERAAGQVYPDPDRCFVQLSETGGIVRTFGQDELCWFIRNPRVDMRWRGYGFPEYDELSLTVDSIYRTFIYNDANFRNGIHAHTIILMRTAMDSTQFDGMKRNMLTMLTQPRNAHRAMVMQLKPQSPGQTEAGREDVDIKQIGQSNSEMEYTNWLNLLIKVMYGGFKMDPAESGIVFGNEGQMSSLAQQGPGERIANSKERGLRPLLRKIEATFDASIVHRMDPDFRMRFVGLSIPSDSERLDLDIKAGKAFLTLNEVRARRDLPKLDIEIADAVPIDPSLINAYLQTASQGDQFDDQGGKDAGPLDEVMKGTDWNDTDEWTAKLAKALAPRLKKVDRGAGCHTWVAEVTM